MSDHEPDPELQNILGLVSHFHYLRDLNCEMRLEEEEKEGITDDLEAFLQRQTNY